MGGSASLQVLHTHPPERTPSYTCTININTHSQLHKLLSLSPLTSQNPMYTSTRKLSHRQTHSTRPSTLCSDQSHRKGFSPPIHLHTHLRDSLFICFRVLSFSQVCQVSTPTSFPSARVQGISFQPLVLSVSQTASDPEPKGLQRGSVDCS